MSGDTGNEYNHIMRSIEKIEAKEAELYAAKHTSRSIMDAVSPEEGRAFGFLGPHDGRLQQLVLRLLARTIRTPVADGVSERPDQDCVDAANIIVALAAAASGGDVQQAPGEAPQSGPPKEGNAQRRKP